MSLALIQESAKEVRRLAIAGSPLAVGDFRLKKLIAPLEQAGAKVPVFAQVAKSIGDVVNGKETDASANLLNLSTLLNAILYTQGQTNADGDSRELETFASNSSSTRTSARVLKPLVHALTSTGSGRYETVKSAVERGAFNDLRLIDPAIQALGDVYPELADLVAEKILPGYGPGIVPVLKAGFDLKGKKSDARRLLVMHQLDPEGTLPLCKTALEDGSPEVKATAIACLGKHEDCLPLVLEQANAKNKQLRAAALEALAEHDRPEVTKLFTELVKGKALDILAGPFRKLHNRQVLQSLLDEGQRVFDLILKGDSEQIPRYREILDCLEYRKETEVEQFALGCFDKSDKLAKVKAAKNSAITGTDVTAWLAALLYKVNTAGAHQALLEKRDVLPPAVFDQVLRSALITWKPERFYEEFSPLLEQKKGRTQVKSEELTQLLLFAAQRKNSDESFDEIDLRHFGIEPVPGRKITDLLKLDPRWLDTAVKADALALVCELVRADHKPAIAYLTKALTAKNQTDAGAIIQALARCQHADVTDLFLAQVSRLAKKGGTQNYELQYLLISARYLPKADVPKLDAFAAKLDEKFMDSFLEAIGPLRTTNQTKIN